jgi:hypothetical protein
VHASQFIKTNFWTKIPVFLCFILLLFTAGCGQIITSRQEIKQEQETNIVEEGTDMSLERQKPLIDSRVPEKLETATFALG